MSAFTVAVLDPATGKLPPSIIPGGTGGGGATVFNVTNVSSQTFAHSYIYPPNVHLVDASGELVLISASYVDATHVFISFPVPFTGTVVLS